MESLEPIIGKLEFFRGMRPEHLAQLATSASEVQLAQGEILGRAGDPADEFWVIRDGRIALELYVPGRGSTTIATMGDGDVVGFSWLLPPFQLHFDAQALSPTRALQFDGHSLREKCARDPVFGYEVLTRFSNVMADRIRAMSLQLLDVFGEHPIESA